MRTITILVACVFVAYGGFRLKADAAPPAERVGSDQAAASGNAISQAIKQSWERAKGTMRDSASQMGDADYGFRPTDQVRTFGQILAHVAGANYLFCAAARGEKTPFAEDHFEKSAKTKAEIVKALDDSLTYCDAAYDMLTDAKAAESITMPFGMGDAPRAAALIGNTGHLQEHYGNLVTYFRIKGQVPPTSRR